MALSVAAGLAVGLLLVWGAVSAINAVSRWYLQRAALSAAQARRDTPAHQNVLFVAVKDGHATGYLATRVKYAENKVFGIAIPGGAFVAVPGQGFGPIGDAYRTGAETAKAAVSNYLSVPFQRYVAVPDAAYQKAISTQSVVGLASEVTSTDLTAGDLAALRSALQTVPTRDVALAPLPVKPVAVGDRRYFQPLREQVAALIKAWWGVDSRSAASKTVLVENGTGQPGIAGRAAQQLISGGFTIVDTKNANGFGYKKTLILLYRGSAADAARVHDLLGVGELKQADDDQGIADVIVVVGKDYRPPTGK
jgi:hypothetical protein